VVAADVELLGASVPAGTEVRVEDGRLGIEDLTAGSVDLVVGDAFGGVSVPWHLATREALGGLARGLAADGVYVANVIDHGPLAFARAYVRTASQVFDEVALLADPRVLAGGGGGNMVVVASDEAVDVEAVLARMAERGPGWGALAGEELTAWVGDAPVLTDDFAPVDQLLTPYGP
jgi:spermidine synthase